MKPYTIDAIQIYAKEESYVSILGTAMLEKVGAIANINSSTFEELDDWEKFSYLYFWFDFKIDSYGFLLLFNLNLAKYFPFIISFLKKIGDTKSHLIFEEAFEIYTKNKVELDASIGKDPLYLFDKYKNLEKLSHQHNKVANSVISKINKHIKENINSYFINQDNNPINPKFNGSVKSYYKNGKLKHEYEVKKGTIVGLFKTFSLQEKLISTVNYSIKIEERNPYIRYYTNGKIAERSYINEDNFTVISEQFKYDGKPIYSERKAIDNPANRVMERYWDNGKIENRTIFTASQMTSQYYNQEGIAITDEEYNNLFPIEVNENYFSIVMGVTPQYQHIAVAYEQQIIDQVPICKNDKEIFKNSVEKIKLEQWQNQLLIPVHISKSGVLTLAPMKETITEEYLKYFLSKIEPFLKDLAFEPAIANDSFVDYDGSLEFYFS